MKSYCRVTQVRDFLMECTALLNHQRPAETRGTRHVTHVAAYRFVSISPVKRRHYAEH
jgi:hypothetical protein